ncbi:hypothetical protein [Massilia sp. DD77]|uniref:hypothetical protein n=1 Tax=Massilia sp. DD77 TaxID=3109349 RepID=UPI002FFE60F9
MSLNKTVRAVLGCAALLTAACAHAQVGVTLDAGTTGAGVHLVVPMETTLNGRFGINYFKHDFEKRSGLIDYQLDGKLQTIDALFDWYLRPGSPFRVTGGVIYNGTRFDAVGSADRAGKFRINGKEYSAADVGVLKGTVNFRKAAPYLGVGWGNALSQDKRLNFSADLGAIYQGEAHVNLVSIGCTTSRTVCTALANDVSVEELRLAEDVSDYKFYPVLRASISYRF